MLTSRKSCDHRSAGWPFWRHDVIFYLVLALTEYPILNDTLQGLISPASSKAPCNRLIQPEN